MGGCYIETVSPIKSGTDVQIGLWVANGKVWVKGMILNGIVVKSNPAFGVRVRFDKRHDAFVRHHVHGLVSRAALVARCAAGDADVAALIRALAVVLDHDPAMVPDDGTTLLRAEGGAWRARAMNVDYGKPIRMGQ